MCLKLGAQSPYKISHPAPPLAHHLQPAIKTPCRDELAGYRVITVSLNDKAEPQGVVPFLSGLLVGDVGEAECPDVPRSNTSAVRGRPVDTLQLPDGSLLVSDDTGNKVYKIMYAGRVPAGGGQVSSGPVSSEDDRVSVFV